ncbi:MAG: Lrp/AsnC family transcriptional regulator [Microthrixaceae bacterium]|nr:Lrp/AsnC family transcriptional regulator [Microthrixaceae bacterium]HMT23634.1 Lrp/AsnC family transcriptional regulator [Microthrixaceae bacterium]HMT61437.1 Lrp/AsnC family transcriptional regulator [Microthrixaceae bacterium]
MRRLPVDLDEVDKSILAELQRDGRVSYADLGPKVGLSAAAARQRVQRLLDNQVVRVVGVTDPQTMGYPVMAMLGIQVDGDVVAVADAIAEIDGVIYIVMTAGSFDLLAEVICEDSPGLLDVINSQVKRVEGVRSVESFMYFATHTHRFGWAVR